MRDFFQAFWDNWLTFMSGFASVSFWLVSAILESTTIPVSVRIGFIAAAACSMYYASYRVWKSTTDRGNKRIAEVEAKFDTLQAQISSKESEIAMLKRAIEEERVAHEEKLRRALAADPERNAIRLTIQKFIGRFKEMANQANANQILVDELFTLEDNADKFLKRRLPFYEHFADDYPIVNSWGRGQTIHGSEVYRRCLDRVSKLNQVLELLSA